MIGRWGGEVGRGGEELGVCWLRWPEPTPSPCQWVEFKGERYTSALLCCRGDDVKDEAVKK